MRVLRAIGAKNVPRNIVFLLVLGGSFFMMPVRPVSAGILIFDVPCFDLAIDGIAFCIATGVCVNSDGVADITIFPYIGNNCSVSPVINQASGYGDYVFPRGMEGEVSSVVMSNFQVPLPQRAHV